MFSKLENKFENDTHFSFSVCTVKAWRCPIHHFEFGAQIYKTNHTRSRGKLLWWMNLKSSEWGCFIFTKCTPVSSDLKKTMMGAVPYSHKLTMHIYLQYYRIEWLDCVYLLFCCPSLLVFKKFVGGTRCKMCAMAIGYRIERCFDLWMKASLKPCNIKVSFRNKLHTSILISQPNWTDSRPERLLILISAYKKLSAAINKQKIPDFFLLTEANFSSQILNTMDISILRITICFALPCLGTFRNCYCLLFDFLHSTSVSSKFCFGCIFTKHLFCICKMLMYSNKAS